MQVRCKDEFGNPVDSDPRTRFWLELKSNGEQGSSAVAGDALVTPGIAGKVGDGSGRPGGARGLESCEAAWADDGLFELRYVTTRAGDFDVVLWCEPDRPRRSDGFSHQALIASLISALVRARPAEAL